jgi:peptidylprolyl isomerase
MKNALVVFSFLFVITIISCGEKRNAADQSTEATEMPQTSGDEQAASFPGFDAKGKDTITLPSGLKYIIIEAGSGESPAAGSEVFVHYTGYLTDGNKFDSSVDRGQPLNFLIGTGMVIRGWDEGISKLRKGEKARLIIPQELGYGEEGFPGSIPPNATLIFDVELVDFKKP